MKTSPVTHSIDVQGGRQRGFTLIEMVVVVMIVGILASAAMPLMALHKRRTQEAELRQSLRTLRMAIDEYKRAYDAGRIAKRSDASGYPPTLAVLVSGVPEASPARPPEALGVAGAGSAPLATVKPVAASPATPRMIYFLRRLPRDPFADPALPVAQSWGLRSYASPPESPAAGVDVFDVYSRSEGEGLDGVPYRQW